MEKSVILSRLESLGKNVGQKANDSTNGKADVYTQLLNHTCVAYSSIKSGETPRTTLQELFNIYSQASANGVADAEWKELGNLIRDLDSGSPKPEEGHLGASLTEMLKRDYMAVGLSFRPWWSPTRTVDKFNQHVMATSVKADTHSVGGTKKIFDYRLKPIQHINSIKTSITVHFERLTLPYPADGVRLLKKSDLDGLKTRVDNWYNDVRQAAMAVQAARASILEDAMRRLGDTYKVTDYPADLSTRYAVEVHYPNLEPKGDLPAWALEAEKQRLARMVDEAARQAHAFFLDQFAELVGNLAKYLAPDARLLERQVTKLQEFITQYQHFNLTTSVELEELIMVTKDIMVDCSSCGDLRQDQSLRQRVRQGLLGVVERLADQVGAEDVEIAI